MDIINRITFRTIALIALLALMSDSGPRCHAQLPQVSDARLGVDLVRLRSGQRLYGFVLAQHPDRTLEVAVARDWLESTYPALARELIEIDEAQTMAAYEKLIARTRSWLEHRQQDRSLAIFLEKELDRFEFSKANPDRSKSFVRVILKPDQFRDVTLQPDSRRKVAALAWQHRIEGATTTPVSLLQKQLEAKGVNLQSSHVDLSEQVSPSIETDRSWCARQALVEHQLRKPLEFQGTGEMLVRLSDNPDFGAVVGQMLRGGGGLDAIGQLGAELGLPEFKVPREQGRWWKRATEEAERDGFRGVLITRMSQSQLSPVVSVELSFFALEQPGDWFLVKQITATADANQQPADRLQQLQNDPQIKGVLDTLKGLGLGGEQSLLDQAMRHGAATQQASRNALGLFNEFASQYTQQLDGQPIPLPASAIP
jgi:hypothetical protein